MELRVLRYFLATAQHENMTKAADELHVSQPALSQQIAELERELGVKLFRRDHRRIFLTDQGQYLQSRAQEIIDLADQTAANIGSGQEVSGTLSIGAGESTAMRMVMSAVGKIMRENPRIHLHLISGDGSEMESSLKKGVIDFAVLMGSRPLQDYHHLQLPESDRWGLVMRKNDPLAAAKTISPTDLIGQPLLVSEQSLEENRLEKWWGDLDEKMNIIGTYSLVYNAQLLVSQGWASMITFDHLVGGPAGHDLTFRPLSPTLRETTTIIWKKNVEQSMAARTFLRALMQEREKSQNSKDVSDDR
jgi:DNA-binding transcriptional LysR family regulator